MAEDRISVLTLFHEYDLINIPAGVFRLPSRLKKNTGLWAKKRISIGN